MSEEKVLTLRGKKAVWAPGGGSGPIDPKRLPEGYPYKEGIKTVIEWDGVTEGKETLGGAYKVSDKTPTVEELAGATLYLPTIGVTATITAAEHETNGIILSAVEMGGTTVGVVKDSGIYFLADVAGAPFTFTYGTETIHTMAPEFLPALTSPNGTKYQLTVADDGTLSAVAVS